MTTSVAADRKLPRIFEDECSKLSVVLAFPIGLQLSRKQVLGIVGGAFGIDHVVAAAQLRHPSDWCITFDSASERSKFLNLKLLQTDTGHLVRLKKVGSTELCGKLLWLPPQIPLKATSEALSKYGKVNGIVLDVEDVDGKNFISGPRTFYMEPKDGLDADSVPHLLDVGGFEALVIIRGRKPLCTICKKIGHIAKSCPDRKGLTTSKKRKKKRKINNGNKKKVSDLEHDRNIDLQHKERDLSEHPDGSNAKESIIEMHTPDSANRSPTPCPSDDSSVGKDSCVQPSTDSTKIIPSKIIVDSDEHVFAHLFPEHFRPLQILRIHHEQPRFENWNRAIDVSKLTNRKKKSLRNLCHKISFRNAFDGKKIDHDAIYKFLKEIEFSPDMETFKKYIQSAIDNFFIVYDDAKKISRLPNGLLSRDL